MRAPRHVNGISDSLTERLRQDYLTKRTVSFSSRSFLHREDYSQQQALSGHYIQYVGWTEDVRFRTDLVSESSSPTNLTIHHMANPTQHQPIRSPSARLILLLHVANKCILANRLKIAFRSQVSLFTEPHISRARHLAWPRDVNKQTIACLPKQCCSCSLTYACPYNYLFRWYVVLRFLKWAWNWQAQVEK